MVRDEQGNALYYLRPDNWEDETFRQNTRQEYNLSVSGGNERFNYYWGSGYLNDEGIIDNSGYKRYSTRLNVDYLAKSWLKVGANLGYAYSNSAYPESQTNKDGTSSAKRLLRGQQHGSCLPHVCAHPRRQHHAPPHHGTADLRLW